MSHSRGVEFENGWVGAAGSSPLPHPVKSLAKAGHETLNLALLRVGQSEWVGRLAGGPPGLHGNPRNPTGGGGGGLTTQPPPGVLVFRWRYFWANFSFSAFGAEGVFVARVLWWAGGGVESPHLPGGGCPPITPCSCGGPLGCASVWVGLDQEKCAPQVTKRISGTHWNIGGSHTDFFQPFQRLQISTFLTSKIAKRVWLLRWCGACQRPRNKSLTGRNGVSVADPSLSVGWCCVRNEEAPITRVIPLGLSARSCTRRTG